uniref:Major sperm protein n=1 Tax=Parascaris univalens TaxID=6257 RepID=A0A914ZQS4_PARUN
TLMRSFRHHFISFWAPCAIMIEQTIFIVVLSYLSITCLLFTCSHSARSKQRRKKVSNKPDRSWKTTPPSRREKDETSLSSTNSPDGNNSTVGEDANDSTAGKNESKSNKRFEPHRKRQIKKQRKTSVSQKKKASSVQKADVHQSTKTTGTNDSHTLNLPEVCHKTSTPAEEGSESTKQNEQNIKSQLVVKPSKLAWKSVIEAQQIQITNPTKDRIAVKVKCSDNRIYRVDPVYSFVDPGSTLPLNVTRCISSNKSDKLVLVTVPANMEDNDPKLLFERTRLTSISQPLPFLEDYDVEDLFMT